MDKVEEFEAFTRKLELFYLDCHALVLVIFVFFIILVRSGCDMGDLCVFSGLGVLYVYGAGPFLGSFVCLWLPRLVLN